jgi:hypothetical protein
MSEEQKKVWEYLLTNALGKANAKKLPVVAEDLGFPPKGTNNDDLRKIITGLTIKLGKPIGTSQEGVFIIETPEEQEEAAQYVERETKADAVRKNGVYKP